MCPRPGSDAKIGSVMLLAAREQRLELAALEGIHLARYDNRHDPQAHRTRLRAYVRHQPIEVRVAVVDSV